LPSSAKQFNIEDKDGLQLWRILVYTKELTKINLDDMPENKKRLYKPPVENFIFKMREELGITVREFHYSKNLYEKKEEARNLISKETKDVTALLTKSCRIFFSDLYHTYTHLKYLRLIVDIASRFG